MGEKDDIPPGAGNQVPKVYSFVWSYAFHVAG